MKSVLVSITVCLLLLSAGCSQSPEKLLATANKYHDNKKYDEASILYQKILAKDKTNAEAYYRLGLNLLDQGRAKEASSQLRRAVDLNPSNTDATVKLCEIYLAYYMRDPKVNKALANDISDLDSKILQRDPNSFDGLRLQGLLAVANKDTEKALASFEKANRIKPYSRDLTGAYAETLAQAGKTDDGIALLKDTLAHDKTWGAGYDLLFVMYGRSGQGPKAAEVLQQRYEAEPANPIAIENLANYKLASGDFAAAEKLMQGTLSNPTAFPMGRMMLGDFYMRAKKPDLALAAYQQGAKDDSKNAVKYQEKIVAIQAVTNHADQAVTMAKDLAEKNPKDAQANGMYAELLLRTATGASLPTAVEAIKKMVDANPADGALRLNLARGYYAMNDRDKAMTAAQQAVSDEQKSKSVRPLVVLGGETLIARVFGDRGDFAKAQDTASQILAAKPGDPDATIIRAKAQISMGRGEQAQSDLEALLQRYPNSSETHMLLANVYLNQHQFDKATAQFEAAYKGTPPDPRGFIGIQQVKMVSGHSMEAVQNLQDLASKNPSDSGLRFELANFQEVAAMIPGNQAKAKDLMQQSADNFKEVLKTNQSSSGTWFRLGRVQRALGQTDAAMASFQEAITRDPKNVDALINQATLLDGLNRKKEAIDMYNKVLAIQSDNPLALNNLAYLSADSGTNLDQAQTYAERAKKKAPDSPDVSDTLGYVYLQKNLNSQAADIFRQNVAAYPNNPTYRFHLAMALLKQGDKQGAKDQASKALQGATPDLQNRIKTFVGQIG